MDMTSNNKILNPKISKVTRKYVQRLREKTIPVKTVILFGSQARGTAGEESDIDLLVVVEKLDRNIRETIIDEAYNVSLEEDVDLIALPCDIQEFTSPLFQADAFYRNVQTDGVVIR
jgi:predicted nucleotidyltransferase